MNAERRLTLGATPSSDVAGAVMGQDLAGGRKGGQLDVVVESSFGGQTQESDVAPKVKIKMMTP